METDPTHPMKFVALTTGLKPYLIRTWERRYGAVRPKRAENNRRLYSNQDIHRLQLLKKAVSGGHSISCAAPLSNAELVRLTTDFRPAGGEKQPATGAGRGAGSAMDEKACSEVVQAALSHVRHLDDRSLESVLSQAAVQLTRRTFIDHVIMPLFHRIGQWGRDGRLRSVNDCMASTVVRSILWDLLRGAETPENAPALVAATPSGHSHEVGALAAALTVSEFGWRAVYFGPSLPAEEIAYAAHQVGAGGVVLSLSHRFDDRRLAAKINHLLRLLGSDVPIIISGSGLAPAKKRLAGLGVFLSEDFGGMGRILDSL